MSDLRVFSPITRLSGLLSAEIHLEGGRVAEANVSSTMFRGFEWIMRDRHVADAVYLTQRVCGICSLAHGAVASYLLDDLYDHDIDANAQYLRNIMFAADFLQNHIRHFYFFSLPDFVVMPDQPPFHSQNCVDCRLGGEDNRRLAGHYIKAVEVSQKSHQLLALFGGKAPHQHSFVHGGAAVAPTADKINQALALVRDIRGFIERYLLPDTELIARCYDDYYHIGQTPGRFLSFGMFRFGRKNEDCLWEGGVMDGGKLAVPRLEFIQEDICHTWLERDRHEAGGLRPAPYKPQGYTWVKSVQYRGRHFEVGPLARMTVNGLYQGGTGTMDRIVARSLETCAIARLADDWLMRLEPGAPPIRQNERPVKKEATAIVEAMRGTLIHSARLAGDQVERYDIITPTVWNFSPKDEAGNRGPVESALVGTEIPDQAGQNIILGRIIRSFDPCLSCATHIWQQKK